MKSDSAVWKSVKAPSSTEMPGDTNQNWRWAQFLEKRKKKKTKKQVASTVV